MAKGRIELTKRQKIKLRSYGQMALVILLAAGVIGVIGLAAGRASLSRRMEREALEAQQAQEQAEEEARQAAEAAAAAEQAANRPPDVDITAWNLRLVRNDTPLEADYEPPLADIERNEQFDARAADELIALIADARAAGYSVYLCSGYRAYTVQYEIYWNHVWIYERDGMSREEAEALTRLSVNYPGGSEHQLGLAADILESEEQDMESWIGGSGLMLWLEQHCAEYGFIVRYPEGKTDITGVSYEPWHLRYVGREAAAYIMGHDLCLEEFLELYT